MAKNINIIAEGLAGDNEGRVLGYNDTDYGYKAPIIGTCERDSNNATYVNSSGNTVTSSRNRLRVDYTYNKAEVILSPATTISSNGQMYSIQADSLFGFGNKNVIDSVSGILHIKGRGLNAINGLVTMTNNTNYFSIGFKDGDILAEWNGGNINGGAYVSLQEYTIVLKYNNGNAELFVNGVSVGTSSYTPLSSNTLNTIKFDGYLRFSKVRHLPFNTDISNL